MTDDIDIDEHDVLDNPLIKSIFPDLTVIKKEVLYEYDEESSVANNVIEDDKTGVICNLEKDVPSLITFPTSYNGYTDCKNLESDIKSSCEYYIRECDDKINISQSKTNKIKPNITNARVRLINLGPYLDNCRKYCEICFILFPNEEEFEVHKKSFHNLTVVNDNHEILKLNRDETQQTKMSSSNKLKCNICQKTFASISGLYKHKRNIHFVRPKIFARYSGNANKTDAINIPIRNNAKVSVNSSNHCFHCNASFSNMQSLIEHLYDTLQTKRLKKVKNTNKNEMQIVNNNLKNQFLSVKSTIHQKHGNSQITNKTNVSVSYSKLSVYRCPICSYYYNNVKFGLNHLHEKHKLKNSNGLLKKVIFNPKCKFCLSECRSIQKYNSHIRKVHKKMLFQSVNSSIKSTKLSSSVNNNIKGKKIDHESAKKNLTLQKVHKEGSPKALSTNGSSQTILKSALFRCNKCDVHFLHSNVALDHTSHLEILINWKCPLCYRIFKKNDELLHMQQHLVTEDFTVYGICDRSTSVILYNCPKCSVHFEENIFLKHFTVCGIVIQNKHVRCKLCGILIDNKLKYVHADHHKNNIVTSKFYIIVQTEVVNTQMITPDYNVRDMMIDNSNESQTLNKRLDEKWLKVYYCNTCKCFINKGRKFLTHKKCNCINIRPAYCTLCGLILSQTGVSTHKRIHEKKTNLTLQDFKFYNMKNQLICPPIPEFPKCNVCGIYFGNLITKLRHDCGINQYITCTDCKKNYSQLGYKLHMYYHNYRLEKHNIKIKQISTVVSVAKKSIISEDSKTNKLPNLESSNEEEESFIYTCKNCDISVSTYDSMVEHCQEHYNPNKTYSLPKVCEDCNLKFDKGCYQYHMNMHKQKKNIKVINFDIHFFMTKYGEWIKRVFDSFSEEQIQNIVNKSIYKYENKIKMQVIQEGHYDSTHYKCDQCKSFIVPYSLFKHFGSQCLTLPKHFCSICKIPFIILTHKIKHEAVHKQTKDLKPFRIVLFNRNEDKVLNESLRFENWCTLFKCRNCDGLVNKTDYKDHLCNRKSLKKCSYCGLLLYPKEYDLHIHKHEEFSSFNSKKIKVVLIGNKNGNETNEIHLENDKVSSFNGKVYDYIYYRCKKCQICMKDFRSTLKHNCSFKVPSSKCTLCGLYFESRKLKSHYLLHESDNNFLIDNITLTDFDHTESENAFNPVVQISETNNIIEDREINNVLQDADILNESINKNEVKHKATVLYKCNCGLHFLETNSLNTHRNRCNPKTRITRQECSKCGLTFSPNILFTHLLKHHGNNKNVFKFEVIDTFN